MSSMKKVALKVDKAQLDYVISYYDSRLVSLKRTSQKSSVEYENCKTAIEKLNYLKKKVSLGKAKFICRLIIIKGNIFSINEKGETNYNPHNVDKKYQLSPEALKELEDRKQIVKLYFKDVWKELEEERAKEEEERKARMASIRASTHR